MKLSGIESVSVELTASFPADATDAMALRVPAPLALERDGDGQGRVSVLVLEMHALGLGRLPPRFDYREVLYRLGVTVDGAPAWLAVRCDIDRAIVRTMARSIIRYPVRRASIAIAIVDVGDPTLTFRARTDSDHLSATLTVVPEQGTPPAVPPRRTFVVDGGALFEVPWDEHPAPVRHHARVVETEGSACRAAFGAPITFAPTAVIHRGRTHFCGAARSVRAITGR